MKLKSIGVFVLACAAICLVIAVERYVSAVTTAKKVAELMGLTYESVDPPVESTICGLVGVVLLVAGARLIFESSRKPPASNPDLISPSSD